MSEEKDHSTQGRLHRPRQFWQMRWKKCRLEQCRERPGSGQGSAAHYHASCIAGSETGPATTGRTGTKLCMQCRFAVRVAPKLRSDCAGQVLEQRTWISRIKSGELAIGGIARWQMVLSFHCRSRSRLSHQNGHARHLHPQPAAATRAPACTGRGHELCSGKLSSPSAPCAARAPARRRTSWQPSSPISVLACIPEFAARFQSAA